MLGNRWYERLWLRLLLFVIAIMSVAMLFFFGQSIPEEARHRDFVTYFNVVQAEFQSGRFEKPILGSGQKQDDELLSVAYQISLAQYHAKKLSAKNEKSDVLFDQAVEGTKTLNDPGILAYTLAQRGHYYYRVRKMSLAMPDMVEVVFLLERYPDLQLPFARDVYRQVGFFLGTIGDYEQANSFLQRSLVLTPDSAFRERASLLDNIGYYALQLQDTAQAIQRLEEAWEFAGRDGDIIRQAKVMGNRALIAWGQGEKERAFDYLKTDIAWSEEQGDSLNTLYATNLLSQFLIEDGVLEEAEQRLKDVQPYAERYRNLIVHRNTLHQSLLKIALQRGDEEAEFRQRRRLSSMQDSLNLFDGDNVTRQVRWQTDREIIAEHLVKSNYEYALEKKKNVWLMGSAIAVVALLGGIYGRNYFRSQREKKQFQQQMQQLMAEADKPTELSVHEPATPKLSEESDKGQQEKLQQMLGTHLCTEENWRQFKRVFTNVYPAFYQELIREFPELSDSNVRVAILQKLDLSAEEISSLLGVTKDAIKKSKQRLRKKMGEERYAFYQEVIRKPL